MSALQTPPAAATAEAFVPVVTSLLGTDLYKFTMLQPMLHSMPANQAEYRFVCRNQPGYPLSELREDVERELAHLCSLRFTEDELQYLGGLRYMKSDFIDFLRIFQLQHRYVTVATEGEHLVIVAQGPQIHVMFFEIFVLAIVNEVYFRRLATPEVLAEGRRRLREKIALLRTVGTRRRHPFEFFDFGVRRRFSAAWQEEVVATFAKEVPEFFKGTSNVHLAKKYGLVPIGTMAHEYLQTFQAMGVQLKGFQKAALENWVQEYRGDLGVALTDVVGMDAFLADFDLYFAKLFDTYEFIPWTHNCELHTPWTCSRVSDTTLFHLQDWVLVRRGKWLLTGRASRCGQLDCPKGGVCVGEPVVRPAGTAACGGRPQAEERVPVLHEARAARTDWLSTGGRGTPRSTSGGLRHARRWLQTRQCSAISKTGSTCGMA